VQRRWPNPDHGTLVRDQARGVYGIDGATAGSASGGSATGGAA
jgi:hypothetical protein